MRGATPRFSRVLFSGRLPVLESASSIIHSKQPSWYTVQWVTIHATALQTAIREFRAKWHIGMEKDARKPEPASDTPLPKRHRDSSPRGDVDGINFQTTLASLRDSIGAVPSGEPARADTSCVSRPAADLLHSAARAVSAG